MQETTRFRRPDVPNRRFERSPVTDYLIDLLRKGKPGDFLTDAEVLEKHQLDIKVNGSHYSNLLEAIKVVAERHCIKWERIRGEGRIKCLESNEIVEVADRRRKSSRRYARRSLATLQCANRDELDHDARRRLDSCAVAARLQEVLNSTSTQKKLMQHDKEIPAKPDMKKLFDWLSESNGNRKRKESSNGE